MKGNQVRILNRPAAVSFNISLLSILLNNHCLCNEMGRALKDGASQKTYQYQIQTLLLSGDEAKMKRAIHCIANFILKTLFERLTLNSRANDFTAIYSVNETEFHHSGNSI